MTTPFWIGVGVGVIACLAVVGLAGLVFYHLGRVLAAAGAPKKNRPT